MGQKRQARECALQILYPMEMVSTVSAVDATAAFFDNFEADPRARAWSEQIVLGVMQHRAALDEAIQGASPRWRVDRMAVVDRCVLRLCVHELMFDADTPARVVIDEGVEIAKRFGAQQSARFVNGVLDAVARALGRLPKSDGRGG